MASIERRSAQRVDVTIEVVNTENNHVIGTIKNLTAVGCFITTQDSLLEVDAITTIRFTLPKTAEEVTTKARVMWHKENPQGMGMLFFSMNDRLFSILQEFVEKTENV